MSENITPENYPESVEDKLCRIEDLSVKQKALTASLRASICIEAIWPAAFDHGTVRFSGTQMHMSGATQSGLGFTEAWFVNAQRKRYLSRDELLQFKPEAQIHKLWDCRALDTPSRYVGS